MRLMILACALMACGDDDGSLDASTSDAAVDSATDLDASDDALDLDALDLDADTDASAPPAFVGGEDRPTRVIVPPGYDPSVAAPLLILLHGYTANGFVQNAYFNLTRKAGERGMLLLTPDGLTDGLGNRHWNATPACCGTPRATDDLAYITGLIDEMEASYSVDSSRIYVMGHSNGGFMSYRLACDAADRITAIASLAGASFDDPERCDPARPISVLQMHGTLDPTIRYDGGTLGRPYPSAMESVAGFAERAGCTGETTGDSFDFSSTAPGDETTPVERTGCTEGLDAALWTIEGGGHLPPLADGVTDRILDWLLTHSL